MRYLLKNALIATPVSTKKGSVAIDGEKIAGIWYDDKTDFQDAELIDLSGLVLMAGGIDAHVHFREPGMTSKADISTESKAALSGGITSFLDMPNTNPPTISIERLKDKQLLAGGRSYCNFGFNFGATDNNLEEISALCTGDSRMFGGIKVFMGSSTGNMLVEKEEALKSIFGVRNAVVMVHSEDENIIRKNLEDAVARYGEDIPIIVHPDIRSRKACIRSTAKALELAIKLGTRLHILHISTAEEVEMIRAAKIHNPDITAETSANYLFFCDEDYSKLQGLIKCNPAIKSSSDKQALRKALGYGIIDTIGSDHAPHLLSEKSRPYRSCPSGIPSIQQSLSAVLTVAKEDGISYEKVASAMSSKTAEIFGIADRGRIETGCKADLVAFDPEEKFVVGRDKGVSSSAAIDYKCGWTPYWGKELRGAIKMVMINGNISVRDGKFIDRSPHGQALEFRTDY